MAKWEYLELSWYFNQGWFRVGPNSKVKLDWLRERFPKVDIGQSPEEYGGEHRYEVKAKEWSETFGVWYAILNYLGTEGWEAFAIKENYAYFKRPLPEAT